MLVTELAAWGLMFQVVKSEGGVGGWGEFGFNLCVAPFPNVCVPNFKLEDLHSELLKLAGGWLKGLEGLEVWKC